MWSVIWSWLKPRIVTAVTAWIVELLTELLGPDLETA